MVDKGYGIHPKCFVLVEFFARVSREIVHGIRSILDNAVVLDDNVSGIAFALFHPTRRKANNSSQ